MPSIQASTINFIKQWEGFLSRAKWDYQRYAIGYGYDILDGETIDGLPLLTSTITTEQGGRLLERHLRTRIRWKRWVGVEQILAGSCQAALTQDQFDALVDYCYGGIFSQVKDTIKAINKHASNVFAGEAEIRAAWTGPITATDARTGQRTILTGLVARRKAEQDLFFGSYLPGGVDQYRELAKTHGKGIFNIDSPDSPPSATNDQLNIAGGPDEPITPLNLEFDFERLENHIRNLELDDVEVSWGRRTNNLEDTDWLGLKQYILYLNTTYFQQHLVPFVELIPVYAIDPPELTSQKTKDQYLKALEDDDLDDATRDKYMKFLAEDDRTLIDYRFERTGGKLGELSKKGGIDLLGVDPFQEVSDSFNTPNFTGRRIEQERGYNYKLYGMITLNPRILGEELSKAGAIGFKSLDIEMGSQTQNNMSLITVKILDVQGNKLLDVNSPWSFILNSRPGMIGADFFFRFGWQLYVPSYNVCKDSGFEDDENAQKFWNHPGWDLFGGSEMKKRIAAIAASAGGVITLTQSIANSSFKSPGYKYENDNFVIERAFDKQYWDKYILLTLINPEISISPEDGSVTATLYFRTNSVVANFLCPLLKAGHTRSLANNGQIGGSGFLGLGRTVGKGYKTNLYTLMESFLKDNNDWIRNSSVQLTTVGKEALLNATDTIGVDTFLIVIGGQGKGSVQLDPRSIPILITNELNGEINRAVENQENSQLLIAWINKVLQDNGLTPLAAGDQRSTTDTTGSIVIYYDRDAASKNVQLLTSLNLAASKNSALEAASGVGGIGAAILQDDIYREGIDNRLQMQDDVFSFRFRGSLVEGLNIDKLETPTLQKLIAQQNVAQGVDFSLTELTAQSEEQKELSKVKQEDISGPVGNVIQQKVEEVEDGLKTQAETTKSYRTADNSVTYKDKKNALNILYASMLGASIKCIGHPWLKIGKNVGIKGTGFFDGKYLVTKIKHTIDEDHKFTTEINACRVLNQEDTRLKNKLINDQKNMLLNNPGVNFSEQAGGIKNRALDRNFQYPIDHTYISPPIEANVEQLNNRFPNSNAAKLSQLNPQFRNLFSKFIERIESETAYKVEIQSGFRTLAKQREIAANNSVAAQGYSLHNFGLAIDINLKKDGVYVARAKDNNYVWRATGVVTIAQELGLVWGGNFANYDPVHFGLDGASYNGFTFRGTTCYAKALSQFGSDYNIIWNQVRF